MRLSRRSALPMRGDEPFDSSWDFRHRQIAGRYRRKTPRRAARVRGNYKVMLSNAEMRGCDLRPLPTDRDRDDGLRRADNPHVCVRERAMELRDVIVAGRLHDAYDAHLGQIWTRERAIVHDLLDRRAGRRNDLRKPRESAGAITDRYREARQPSVRDEPDLDHAIEHREIDVAAAQHEHDLPALERVELAGEKCRERRRASAFDDALLELDQAQDRERDGRLVDGEDLVDHATQYLEREAARFLDRLAVGERRRKRYGDRMPRGVIRCEAGGVHRFDADYKHIRFARLDDRSDTRKQAAAADRRDDRLNVGCLLEDLECDRSLAGHHLLVVERMDECQTIARRDRLRFGACLRKVRAVQSNGRT